MTVLEIMALADAYANEACRGNEYDNRDKTGAARQALLDALKKSLKRRCPVATMSERFAQTRYGFKWGPIPVRLAGE